MNTSKTGYYSIHIPLLQFAPFIHSVIPLLHMYIVESL